MKKKLLTVGSLVQCAETLGKLKQYTRQSLDLTNPRWTTQELWEYSDGELRLTQNIAIINSMQVTLLKEIKLMQIVESLKKKAGKKR